MIRQHLFLMLLFCTHLGLSQNLFFQYSTSAGTAVRDLEADSLGNVYAVGRGGIAPSCVDTTAISSRGTAYIAKFDPIGNVIWRLNFGGSRGEAKGLDIDRDGNLVVVGTFHESGDFSSTPTPTNPHSGKLNEIFVMKVSPDGEVIWVQTAGGQSDSDQAFDVDTGTDGTIYVIGTFNFWVDFGNIELVGTNFNQDPFIWALRPEGFTKWAKQIPSGAASEGENISVDNEGNIVTVSRINDLDPRKLIIHIAKYSPDGEQLFVKKIPVSIYTKNGGLETDAQNNIYLTGYLSGTNGDSTDFDPGPNSHVLYGSGQLWGDAYLLKLDKNGEFVWVLQTGDDRGPVSGSEIEIDDSGNIFVSGSFKNTVDFDPGPGVFDMSTDPQRGTSYFQVLDSTGTFITALHGGSLTPSQGFGNSSLALGQNGKVHVGREVAPGFNQGHIDVFGDCPITFIHESINACAPYDLDGFPITSGCSIRTLLPDSISGCDVISSKRINIVTRLHADFSTTDSTIASTLELGDIVWLDCEDDFAPIPGTEGNYLFQPERSGIYTFEIALNGCRDTFGCLPFEVMTSDIFEKENPFLKTEIFPNPFSEKITIKNLPPAFAEISIFDLSGKLIFEKEKATNALEIEISSADFPKGIFTIFIKNEKEVFRKIIIK